jgi:SOS-response transcriptional repressor LexA
MSIHGESQRSKIIDAIRFLVEANGYSPTVREIAERVGLSSTGAYEHLKILSERGIVAAPRRHGAGWELAS